MGYSGRNWFACTAISVIFFSNLSSRSIVAVIAKFLSFYFILLLLEDDIAARIAISVKLKLLFQLILRDKFTSAYETNMPYSVLL